MLLKANVSRNNTATTAKNNRNAIIAPGAYAKGIPANKTFKFRLYFLIVNLFFVTKLYCKVLERVYIARIARNVRISRVIT